LRPESELDWVWFTRAPHRTFTAQTPASHRKMTQPRRGRPPHSPNPDASHADRLGAEIRLRRQAQGLTLKALATLIGFSSQHLSEVELAKAPVSGPFVAACDRALDARGDLLDLLPAVVYERAMQRHERSAARKRPAPIDSSGALDLSALHGATGDRGVSDELEAIELGRRAQSGDVSAATLDGLALGVHELCRRYTRVPPAALIDAVRGYRRHVFALLDARATLRQRRELMVTAGWLSLLAACLHVDLGQHAAARASRRAAHELGVDAGDRQIVAWGLEIRAWQAILARDYDDAVKLCGAGRDLAGRDTSAAVQLVAQEAGAQARLGRTHETHRALDQATASCGRLPAPEHADHHFTFDPRKLTSYTATALAWLGDGQRAEPFAREIIDLRRRERRPRRVATARIDLALILAQQDRPEEASDLGHLALDSGRLVRSNIWRVGELDNVLSRHPDAPEVRAFHERYLSVRQLIAAEGSGSSTVAPQRGA
jgi:transcriptional regulator with XRE-family HTH domain